MKINRLFDGIWIMTRVMQSAHYPRQNIWAIYYCTKYSFGAEQLVVGTQSTNMLCKFLSQFCSKCILP